MGDAIRILHVDDDPDFADVTAEFLQRGDDRFTIETALGGADGLARLTPAVDCIISDYEMPGMDGLEFLEAVREDHPDLPFILFTGKGSEEVASEALTLGATDYLQKATGTDQYELLANRVSRAVAQFRAERELERKNVLLEKTQDLADVGAWEYDPRADAAYFTDQVYEIYGVDTDYKPNPEQDIERFYHPDDRETVRDAVAGALEDGEPYDIEVRIIAADGTEKWVRTRADPQFENGTCKRVRGTIRDITERKEREQNIAQTKEWYQTLLDGAPDAVFVADADSGEIRETNQAATRLLGRSREEIVGLDQTALHPPEKAGEYADVFSEHVGAGGGRDETLGEQVELAVVDTDGEQIPVEINAQTVEIDGEEYNQGYFRDISARKERERELRRQNDRLDEFVTVVSHDLRNPLRTLSASLDLIETDDEESLERCHDTVARMERLIDNLVNLARHGETDSEPAPVRLPDLARASARTTGVSADALSVTTDATIVAEESRLRHLFENLFANAISHGGQDVSITVGRLDDGFYVADDGSGIPVAERDRVFRVGYSTSGEGTGFGLNIVKQVAEAHGWSIRATASAEGGARFEITGVEFTAD
ncbi:PAS domain S-box protein [Halomicroarcula sp. F28]|uniref:PAS domain S-box protein n=1 Tax=Haloarcula salinisoli TaxID=2487746 RepID=UPI001C73AD93|nr:PAS domain S-box protein [Halomicroarcula salinisoli]MBX0285797.1 PAS domain S-box protein [Halomicroarcula salinisoli]